MSFIKRYFRFFLINLLALWLTAFIFTGVSFIGGWQTIALAALVLTLLGTLIKPLVKLLLLPVNLITLGAFRWLVNVIVLWLVTFVIPQFQIKSFLFEGFNYQGFIIPSFYVATFWAFVLSSLVISLTNSLALWLIKK